MAAKQSRRKKPAPKTSPKKRGSSARSVPPQADLGVPRPDVKQFMKLYENKRFEEAEQSALAMTQRYPQSAFAWKALGTTLLADGRAEEALAHLHRSVELNDADPLSLTSLAAVYYQQGEHEQAVHYQRLAVELQPDYGPAQYRLAEMLQMAGKQLKALEHAKRAQELGFDDFRSRVLVGALLYQTKYFSQALEIYRRLEQDYPGSAPVYNNLGNLYKDIGQYELSETYYQKALDDEPDYVMAYSNIFFSKHYNPGVTQQEIIDFAKGWDARFALPMLPAPANSREPVKPLRVGLISSGFRIHPVGQMIATALAHSRPDIHYYAYSTNDHVDDVTRKIRETTRMWRPVRHLSQESLAQQIRDDAVDILIDLSGHGDGSCLQAISMRPAPICVKWVGGLVNTMGLASIDYLLSDFIETPEGVDDQYTEKLIRLPDDYICYMPCPYAPPTTSLPAIKNGYVTLGCLNNPAKIGKKLLSEWAKLMQELPDSRLLLRGAQYESEDFCNHIRTILAEQGIDSYRVILEGPTKHKEFLETYQRIDIALDTWPYSGGLTTCEAMLMGVPVVTLPGPAFAGRHSATHLINCGLQELVTNSWDEYRKRALELANDLPNLAVIRAGLRTILHYSPVCDAPRFANHFNNALRAIWVRYCEGKAPEALTFNKEGELWFEDDKQPLELPEARSEEEIIEEPGAFEWNLDEPITIIDNAALLPRHPDYPKWMASGHLAVISFDPASLLNKRVEELQEFGELHHYPHALLGDGQPATLYATLDAEKGSTLKPLPEEQQPEYMRDKLKVLTELPINTVALDQIEGLPSVDMLVLDELHDAMKVLENGQEALKNTLLIQVKVAFQPTHERQPNLAELQRTMAHIGFKFYRYKDIKYLSHMPNIVQKEDLQASKLAAADVIFLPSLERMAILSDDQLKKLAFLLHAVYDITSKSHELLASVSEELAVKYVTALEVNTYQEGNQSAHSRLVKKSYQEKKGTVADSNNALAGETLALKLLSEEPSPSHESMPNITETEKATTNSKRDLWVLDEPIHVVDIGANPIDGTPPYAGLLQRGLVQLVGFEPQEDALKKLQAMKGPNETYLPQAIGTGEKTKLYLCQASGMTSTLKPNNKVLDHFQGYPIWGKVKGVEEINTVRLDDVGEIEKIDWLKIDIQGGELNVFKNAEKKLKEALVIQTEVNFIELYEDQPLFAEIDQWMRAHGFMLHALIEQRRRLYAPMKINGGIHQGINQLTTADAVYIKDVNSIKEISRDGVKKIAFILHEAYGSFDLSLKLLKSLSFEFGEKYVRKINKPLPIKLSSRDVLSKQGGISVKHCFVVGCGHTGTTLMATILGQNDSVYTIKRETGWFLGGREFFQELEDEEFIASSLGSTWLCEKTPRHVYCYHGIVEKFAEAKFVVMTRCARDVVASIKNRTGDFDLALSRWLEANKEVVNLVGIDNVILVRYEDLVTDVERSLKKVCAFLGIDFSPSMLDFHKSDDNWFGVMPKQTDGRGEKAHLERRAWQMTQPLQDRRGVWKGVLNSEEVRVVDQAARELMKKLGYEE